MDAKNLPPKPAHLPPGTRVYPMATRWKVKQSLLWSDMSIKDPWGEKRFRATEPAFNLFHNLRFSDTETGENIGRIQQEFTCGMPKYSIVVDGELLAVVEKLLTCCISSDFHIELVSAKARKSCGGRYMRIVGKDLDYSYTLEREDGGVVAEITRGFMSLRDTYAVDISRGEDVFFVLACCIVIDKCTTES